MYDNMGILLILLLGYNTKSLTYDDNYGTFKPDAPLGLEMFLFSFLFFSGDVEDLPDSASRNSYTCRSVG